MNVALKKVGWCSEVELVLYRMNKSLTLFASLFPVLMIFNTICPICIISPTNFIEHFIHPVFVALRYIRWLPPPIPEAWKGRQSTNSSYRILWSLICATALKWLTEIRLCLLTAWYYSMVISILSCFPFKMHILKSNSKS